MKCDKCQSILLDLLYDELGEAERRQALAHLAECPTCGHEYTQLLETRAAFHALPDPEVPAFLNTRILAHAKDKAGKKRGLLDFVLSPRFAMAAVVVLAVSVAILIKGPFSLKQAPEQAPITELSKMSQPSDQYAANQANDNLAPPRPGLTLQENASPQLSNDQSQLKSLGYVAAPNSNLQQNNARLNQQPGERQANVNAQNQNVPSNQNRNQGIITRNQSQNQPVKHEEPKFGDLADTGSQEAKETAKAPAEMAPSLTPPASKPAEQELDKSRLSRASRSNDEGGEATVARRETAVGGMKAKDEEDRNQSEAGPAPSATTPATGAAPPPVPAEEKAGAGPSPAPAPAPAKPSAAPVGNVTRADNQAPPPPQAPGKTEARKTSGSTLERARQAEKAGEYKAAASLYEQAMAASGPPPTATASQEKKRGAVASSAPAPEAPAAPAPSTAAEPQDQAKPAPAKPACSPSFKAAAEGALRCYKKLGRLKDARNLEKQIKSRCE